MISAVLIVKNEAKNLPACLQALQKVVDEIIVVDHESDDDTKKVALKFNAKVFNRKWEGYAAGKNFGNQQASHDWILSIDADEIVSSELINTIRSLKFTNNNEVFAFDRANYFGDTWVKHCGWYPDWKVRIFHKSMAKWEGDFVHEKLRFLDKMTHTKLEGKLRHNSYKTEKDHLERIERYAKLGAEQLINKRKSPSWLKQKLSPGFRFFRTYILKKGFLDGKLGWDISKRNAYMIRRKYELYSDLLKKLAE